MNKRKQLAANHPKAFRTYTKLYNKLHSNSVRMGRGSVLVHKGALLRGCKIVDRGANNRIEIGCLSRLYGCEIEISGNNNTIRLGKHVFWNQVSVCIEDDKNTLVFGDDSSIQDASGLSVIEGTTLSVGSGCLLSGGIDIRTGDSHSVVNSDGRRINPSENVKIEDRIWIGTRAIVLKGTAIPDDCVIGAGSVVRGIYEEPGCVIAGNPARIVKRGIAWIHERI